MMMIFVDAHDDDDNDDEDDDIDYDDGDDDGLCCGPCSSELDQSLTMSFVCVCVSLSVCA